MKCPNCQAKLMPVDGQMFCLQCGETTAPQVGGDNNAPPLEDTTDPVLQRAIVDALQHEVEFRLPVSQAAPPTPKTKAFVSMRSVMAPPRVALAGAGAAAMAPSVAIPEDVPLPVAKVDETSAAVKPGTRKWQLPLAWMIGLSVFALFVLVNIAIYMRFVDRVYPGVKAGALDLSGVPYSQLHQRLESALKHSALTVEVDGSSYVLDTSGLPVANIDQIERNVRSIGHSTPLPLAGLVRALYASPVATGGELSDSQLNQLAGKLAQQINTRPSNAHPMVLNGQVVVLTEKPGFEIDVNKAKVAIGSAYHANLAVSLKSDRLEALITTAGYEADIAQAHTLLSLSLQLKRKAEVFSPTPQVIGQWLAFGGPGKGVIINSAAVSAYVAGLPGSFDRVGAANALLGALNTKQNLSYTVSTKKNTAAPNLTVVPGAGPAVYRYCLDAGIRGTQSAETIKATLVSASGWGLGGAIVFTQVEDNCNFRLRLADAAAMKQIAASCEAKTSCLASDVLAINTDSFKTPPVVWKGSAGEYQRELINHETGHWLGFEHASCTATTKTEPILEAPNVVVPGCSPNWYAVPAEVQGTKQLNQL